MTEHVSKFDPDVLKLRYLMMLQRMRDITADQVKELDGLRMGIRAVVDSEKSGAVAVDQGIHRARTTDQHGGDGMVL